MPHIGCYDASHVELITGGGTRIAIASSNAAAPPCATPAHAPGAPDSGSESESESSAIAEGRAVAEQAPPRLGDEGTLEAAGVRIEANGAQLVDVYAHMPHLIS